MTYIVSVSRSRKVRSKKQADEIAQEWFSQLLKAGAKIIENGENYKVFRGDGFTFRLEIERVEKTK